MARGGSKKAVILPFPRSGKTVAMEVPYFSSPYLNKCMYVQ